jgi:hypothetical protein
VHPDWLERQHLPTSDRGRRSGRDATTTSTPSSATSIATASNGRQVLPQRLEGGAEARFMARSDPDKKWKFKAADVAERAHWDEYMRPTTTRSPRRRPSVAPWYVIPADNKRVMQAMAVSVIVETIHTLDLHWPIVSDAARQANAEARMMLEAESD